MSNSYSDLQAILSYEETHGYRRFPVISNPAKLSGMQTGDHLTCLLRLAEYSFDEIKINDQYKEILARLFAQTWLLTRANFDYMCRFSLPLSLLLDKNYEFDFDQQKIFSELFSYSPDAIRYPKLTTHPFQYDERLGLFPELKKLNSLSLPTKFTFALILFESDCLTGFVSKTRNHPSFNFDLFSDDFDLLEREGLITTRPTFAELLRCFEMTELKRFAKKMDIFPYNQKDNLIHEIILNAAPPEIQKFVHEYLKIESPILIKVTNLQVLRRFMQVEANRFNIYLEWLAFRLCQMPSVIKPIMISVPRSFPGDNYLKIKQVESGYLVNRYHWGSFNSKGSSAEDIYLKSVWDSNCESIIKDATLDDGLKEVINYLFYNDAVERLRKHLGKEKWENTLRNFIASKYIEKYHPSSALKICPGCDHEFREYSVNWYFFQCVKGNIQFCQFCYEKILEFERRAFNTKMANLSDSVMLNDLNQLYKSLERIPTIEFLRNIPLRLPSYPTQKQVSVGKSLLEMPSQGLYVERFGSWLKSLQLAGILEGEIRKTSRGYQVIAKDGHICLSLAEKVIDDWLSDHDVLHEKEPKYPFHVEFNPNRLLRADWKVKDVLIEYAGLMDDYEYARKMKRKKSLADVMKLEVIVLNERNLDELGQELGKLLNDF